MAARVIEPILNFIEKPMSTIFISFKGAPANLTFTSNKTTAITPSITLLGGAPTPAWRVTESDGQEFVYNTAAFSHTKTAPGDMTVVLENTADIAPYVTKIDFSVDGLTSTLADLHVELFTELETLFVNINSSLTGDVSAVAWPASLRELHCYSTAVSGDVSAVAWPASLADLAIFSTAVSGDVSAVAWPAGLQRILIYSTAVTYSGIGQPLSLLPALNNFRIDGCGLAQAAVDAILFDLYSGCVARTATGGTINVGGSNAAPSGVYQPAASCPVTALTPGKEAAYELVNNTCAVASFNPWTTVTFTA